MVYTQLTWLLLCYFFCSHASAVTRRDGLKCRIKVNRNDTVKCHGESLGDTCAMDDIRKILCGSAGQDSTTKYIGDIKIKPKFTAGKRTKIIIKVVVIGKELDPNVLLVLDFDRSYSETSVATSNTEYFVIRGSNSTLKKLKEINRFTYVIKPWVDYNGDPFDLTATVTTAPIPKSVCTYNTKCRFQYQKEMEHRSKAGSLFIEKPVNESPKYCDAMSAKVVEQNIVVKSENCSQDIENYILELHHTEYPIIEQTAHFTRRTCSATFKGIAAGDYKIKMTCPDNRHWTMKIKMPKYKNDTNKAIALGIGDGLQEKSKKSFAEKIFTIITISLSTIGVLLLIIALAVCIRRHVIRDRVVSLTWQTGPIMLIHVNEPDDASFSQAVSEFGRLLEVDYGLLVHHFQKQSDKQRIVENKHDWIEHNIQYCEHFIFILSDRLLKMYNDGGQRHDFQNDMDMDNTLELANYTLKSLRHTKNKKCHFVSFTKDGKKYGNQIQNLPGIVSKAQVFNIIRMTSFQNDGNIPILWDGNFQKLLKDLNVPATAPIQCKSNQCERFLKSIKVLKGSQEQPRERVHYAREFYV